MMLESNSLAIGHAACSCWESTMLATQPLGFCLFPATKDLYAQSSHLPWQKMIDLKGWGETRLYFTQFGTHTHAHLCTRMHRPGASMVALWRLHPGQKSWLAPSPHPGTTTLLKGRRAALLGQRRNYGAYVFPVDQIGALNYGK